MTQEHVAESPQKTQQHVGNGRLPSNPAQSFQGGLHPVAQLQRTLGNRKVAQLLQTRQLTPEGKLAAGGAVADKQSLGQALAPSHVLQRFGSLEHQGVANEGSGQLKYQQAGLALNQGDLTMLRGDYFEEKDLLEFWRQPGSFMLQLGTQWEIIYAIYDATSGKDPRFTKGGLWYGMVFSDAVKTSVARRYYALADKNYAHFVNPGFGIGGNGMPIGGAGATYREAHERAITAAFNAGAAGKSMDGAQIIEAMGQHFLTDAFAAGHVTTQRGKIEKDWDARYPNFPYQITNRIVLDMADFLIRTGEDFGQYLPQKKVEAKVRKVLSKTFALKGQITLGKMIGLVAHDYDNDNGLWFVNRVGQRWFGYGDGNLDRQPMGPREKGEKTHREIILMAVKAGIDDIRHAYAIGQSGKKLAFPDLSDAVRQQSAQPAFPGSFYAPEMYMPQLDPSVDQERFTDSDSIENLFETRVRRNGPSYRELIQDNVRKGTIHDELKAIADDQDSLPETDDALFWGLAKLHPKEAFENTVIRPLEHDPATYLIYVIRTG